MAQVWIPSFKKRVMLGTLELLVPLARSPQFPTRAKSNAEVQRILVIELWNIGDVVLAMPFLAQLRVIFPNATITLLSRPYARTILAGTHLVDRFIDTELGWSARSVRRNPFAYHWRELARIRRALKGAGFDIAFSSRMHVREHLVLALSGAKRTVAFALGSGNRILTDPVSLTDLNRHKVDDWLELLKPFGGTTVARAATLNVTEAERRWATDFLAKNGVSPGKLLVGIHPGASVPEKRWPLARFADVAQTLTRIPDTNVLAFVAPDGYGEELSQIPGVITATVSLRELIALIQRCNVLVCNDSGPMHLAGALDVPTVSIFGSGISRWFSPLGSGHHLLTATRDDKMSQPDKEKVAPFDVAGVSTSDVLKAIIEVLGTSPGGQP